MYFEFVPVKIDKIQCGEDEKGNKKSAEVVGENVKVRIGQIQVKDSSYADMHEECKGYHKVDDSWQCEDFEVA